MIKRKIITFFLLFGLVCQNFIGIVPVFADGSSATKIISSAELKYANFPDKKITYVVDSRYHDSENPLALFFSGDSLPEEEKYTIDLNIYDLGKPLNEILSFGEEKELLKSMRFEKTGAEINTGITESILGFTMEFMDEEHLTFDWYRYYFELFVNGEKQDVSSNLCAHYAYEGINNLSDFSTAHNEDGTKLYLSKNMSAPGLGVVYASDDIYFDFNLQGLPEEETFTYELYKAGSDNTFTEKEKISSGAASGKDLANGLMKVKIGTDGHYAIFLKNKLGGIITWNLCSIQYDPSQTGIVEIGVRSGNQTLNLQNTYGFPRYNAIPRESVYFNLKANDLEETKEYSVAISACLATNSARRGSCGEEEYGEIKTFIGSELMSGTAEIELPYIAALDNWNPEATPTYDVDGSQNVSFAMITFKLEDEELWTGRFIKGIAIIYSQPSFSAKLSGEGNFAGETSIYLSVDDYKNLSKVCNGICGLIGDLEFDEEKLELVSVEELNNFELINGDHYVLHNINGEGIPAGTNILKFDFKNKGLANGDSTMIKFKNIIGSDGENDIPSDDVEKTITFIEPVATIESSEYDIEEEKISSVEPETTVEIFLSGFALGGDASAKVFAPSGEEMSPESPVGTGSVLKLYDRHGSVVNEYKVLIMGDVNGDGKITITDLVKTKRHLAGLETLSDIYAVAADITNTNSIGITDVVKICRHIAGLGVIIQ